jgi:hypothetical protein
MKTNNNDLVGKEKKEKKKEKKNKFKKRMK